MDAKNILAGVLVAFGISNLLRLFNVPFSISLGFVVAGVDLGTFILAIASLALAYYLARSK